MKNLLLHILVLVGLHCQAQQIEILKSTTGSTGGTFFVDNTYRYRLDCTVGQPSLTRHFQSESMDLVQGFQHHRLNVWHNRHEQIVFFEITAFPNPSSGPITLNWNDSFDREKASLSLVSIGGKVVENQDLYIDKSSAKIDLTHIPKGIYQLQVKTKRNASQPLTIILK